MTVLCYGLCIKYVNENLFDYLVNNKDVKIEVSDLECNNKVNSLLVEAYNNI